MCFVLQVLNQHFENVLMLSLLVLRGLTAVYPPQRGRVRVLEGGRALSTSAQLPRAKPAQDPHRRGAAQGPQQPWGSWRGWARMCLESCHQMKARRLLLPPAVKNILLNTITSAATTKRNPMGEVKQE